LDDDGEDGMAKPVIDIDDRYQLEPLGAVLESLDALHFEIEAQKKRARASSDIAEIYVVAEAANRQLEVVVDKVQALIRGLQQITVPELFREGNATSVTVLGYRVTTSSVVRASIRKDTKDNAFAWLKAEGHGDLIKVEPTVHPETLAAWARVELEQGTELPEELFSVYTHDTTSLTKAKQK
jgi:seryl-tRNA synthetase